MSTLFTIPDPVEIAYRRAISAIVKSWLPTKLTGMSDSYWLRELASVSSRRSVVSASTDVAMKMFSRDQRDEPQRLERSCCNFSKEQDHS